MWRCSTCGLDYNDDDVGVSHQTCGWENCCSWDEYFCPICFSDSIYKIEETDTTRPAGNKE